jgi:hypothetical protein
VAGGVEVFAGTGGTYILTLRDDGTHLSFASDGTQSWFWDGTYTYTISTITVDDLNHPSPDQRSIDTSTYAVCGNRLFYLGEDPNDPVKATFKRGAQNY